jgi:hypothetical protein
LSKILHEASTDGQKLDAILVGYYEGERLIDVARLRNCFVPASQAALFKRLCRAPEFIRAA